MTDKTKINDRKTSEKLVIAANQHIKERDFWHEKFFGEFEKVSFPYDFTGPDDGEKARFNSLTVDLTGEIVEKSAQLSKGSPYTSNLVMTTAVTLLLGKYSGKDDVTVGMPIYKQKDHETPIPPGDFINRILPLRTVLNGSMSIKQALLETRRTISEAVDHVNYPIEILVQQLDLDQTGDTFPLFDTAVVTKNIHQKEDILYINPSIAIIFSFFIQANQIEIEIEYNSLLFLPGTIERIAKHFRALLLQIVSNADILTRDIDLMDENEKHCILAEFNNTMTPYPHDKTLSTLFYEQAGQTPDHIALIGEDANHISYKELNIKTDKLAGLLHEKNIGPETLVGIFGYRCLETIMGVLGIVKAGGAYLPIDPDYPPERIHMMVNDSSTPILLSKSDNDDSVKTKIQGLLTELIDMTGFFSSSPSHSYKSPCVSREKPNDLAYVIYTSGSTGNPKGVMIENQSVVRLVKNTNYVAFNPGDRILQTGALEFDASTFEIWGALLNGLTLCIIPKDHLLDAPRIKEAIYKNDISTLWMTSPLFNRMVQEDIEIFNGLKNLLVGGDVISTLHAGKIKDAYPVLNFVNCYGPTENTTFSTTYNIETIGEGSISIGKPISNSTALILDRFDKLVPVGVPGELAVGGDGVARGYMNNPELTRGSFIKLPLDPAKLLFENVKTLHATSLQNNFNKSFCGGIGGGFHEKSPLGIFYKTGDLARWLPDGNIEFLGRRDFQVKIRGFRVELSEIEYRLLKHPDVFEAVVMVRDDEKDKKTSYLCAYIVAQPGKTLQFDQLRLYLSTFLPGFMIPSTFVPIDSIPLNSNGKVDRRVLPKPSFDSRKSKNPPRTEIEKKIEEIWREVLGLDRCIDIDENMFLLGGHSLKAAEITAKIQKTMGAKISLAEVFKNPTIQGMSEKLNKGRSDVFIPIEPVEKKYYYELSFNQKRLWIIYQLDPQSKAYLMPEIIPLYRVDIDALQSAINQLFQRHESFRTGFKDIQGEPVQFIVDDTDIKLPFQFHDLSRLTEEEITERAPAIAEEVTTTPFDLQTPPLFRAALVKFNQDYYTLFFCMHHIISDGWSNSLIKEEFNRFYTAFLNGNQLQVKPPHVQYKDFAAWYNIQTRNPEIKKKSHAYWKRKIEEGLPRLELPMFGDGSREDKQGKFYRCVIDSEIKLKLQQLAVKNNTTLAMVLFSMYNLLLAFLSGQQKIVSSIISAGRPHLSLYNIVGYFINSVIIKTTVDLEEDFITLLDRVNQNVLEAYQYQDYPLELVLDDLKMDYPRVTAAFNLLNMQNTSFETKLESLESYHSEMTQQVKVELSLFLKEYKNGIEMTWEYQKSILNPDFIETIAGKFIGMIDEISSTEMIPNENESKST